MENHKVYFSLGSNIGDRKANLQFAINKLSESGYLKLKSSIYETESWGVKGLPDFFNCAIMIEGDLNENDWMQKIFSIENAMGRIRKKKWESRIIDIDILFFSNMVIENNMLLVPHPHIARRRFVLLPMNEIAPAFIHPVTGLSISEMLKKCTDSSVVKKISDV